MDTGPALGNHVLSSTPRRDRHSYFQVFIPPSLQGTVDTRETFILAQRENRF